MKNRIIESTIEQVVDQSQISFDAKPVFKQYIKNKFSDNDRDNDLKQVLALIVVEEGEEYYEDVNS